MKIHPDRQFIPTQENIAKILHEYGLELVSWQEATSGMVNTTILTATNKGAYVIRIYRNGKKSMTEIESEFTFVQYLRDHGIKTPQVVKTSAGELISVQHHGKLSWHIVLMRRVDGAHVQYTPNLIKEIATIQAQMHTLGTTYDDTSADVEDLTELSDTYFTSLIDLDSLSNQDFRQFIERAATYHVDLDTMLPRGLCHLDYDTENILCKDDTVAAVLDFDDLARAPYIVCLAYTLWHVEWHAGIEAAKTYLDVYKTIRNISPLEEQYIKPIMLFRHYIIAAIDYLEAPLESAAMERYVAMEQRLRR